MNTSSPNLIALYSSIPGSGKTTAAIYLTTQYGYEIVPFADTLKNMIGVLLEDLGIEDGYEYIYYNKHTHLSSCDQIDSEIRSRLDDITCRELCQTLGTEWGRNLIHRDLWILVWKAKVKKLLNSYRFVCVDDCRFPNEFEMIKSLGGQVWKIHRPNHSVASSITSHASEHALDSHEFDCVVCNDSDVSNLYKNLDVLLQSSSKILV